MQLIWLSSPTSKLVTLSIGRRAIVWTSMCAVAFLIMLGAALQLMGIRFAINFNPDLARYVGGVTSQNEQDRIASEYEHQIAQLHDHIQSLSGMVTDLETTKKGIVQLVPVAAAPRVRSGGQGGPIRSLVDLEWFAPRAIDALVDLDRDSNQLSKRIQQLATAWKAELQILTELPVQAPILVQHYTSSSFGFRSDPFTGRSSRHEGQDFVAPVGSPIHATAAGTVVRAQRFGPYGNTVDIDHGRGFTTRYAHMRSIDVTYGQQVEAGTVVGRLGNTGRSTGPHLHYEVRLNGRAMNPHAANVIKAAKSVVASERRQLAQK